MQTQHVNCFAKLLMNFAFRVSHVVSRCQCSKQTPAQLNTLVSITLKTYRFGLSNATQNENVACLEN